MNVDEIVGRESAKLAYGAQNPYARVAEYKTVAAVTRQDLLDWHHAHVSPNNIILGIVGDFDSAAMEAKLRQTYGAWPKGPAVKDSEYRAHAGQAWLLPGQERRCQPELDQHGGSRHQARQSRLLRGPSFQ